MTDDAPRVEARDGRNPGQRILNVSGRLVFPTRLLAMEFLEHARVETSPVVILDLRGVTFCDSSGVGALTQLLDTFKRENRRFAIVPSDRVTFVLGIAQVLDFFTRFSTVEEAEDAVVPR
jgi:anti-anti-sigma factor